MVYAIIFLYFLTKEQPVIIEQGPMTIFQCRKMLEDVKDISKMYKADGIDILCYRVVSEDEKEA